MVKVASSMYRSTEPIVQVEIIGAQEAMRYINQQGIRITDNIDLAVFQAGNYVQGEIQESIIGNRAEQKSVDTGRFGNSIRTNKTDWATCSVAPEKQFYPGTQVTTQDVAMFLEYGTVSLSPRRHFRNTVERTRATVVKRVGEQVNKGIRRRYL